MDQLTNYYKVLGIPEDASPEDVKVAYREMSRKWNTNQPKFQNDPDAHERMVLINLAKEVLSDPNQRKQYDALRAEALKAEYSDRQSSVPCRPKPVPSTVDFGEIEFGKPSVIKRVLIRPDPPESWVDGDLIELSSWAGKFWRHCGFERPDPDVVLVHKFEPIVPQDLKPGDYIDTATVSFGDRTAQITFRATVLSLSPTSSGNPKSSSVSRTTTAPLAPSATITPSKRPKRALAALTLTGGIASIGVPFLIMFLALGGHSSGNTTAADIAGIPCFALLAYTIFGILPASFVLALELWAGQ